MDTPALKSVMLAIVTKIVTTLAALILIYSAFVGHRPLLGAAFAVFATLQMIGIVVLGTQKKELGYMFRLPFMLVFLLLVVFDFII